jgi:hypothetical protein
MKEWIIGLAGAAAVVALACEQGPPIACGDEQCSPRQYCVKAHASGGAAPPPGSKGLDQTSFVCVDRPPKGPSAFGSCSEPRGHHVDCEAMMP